MSERSGRIRTGARSPTRKLSRVLYESGLWQRWPSLVLEEGFEPQAATSLCLLFGETYFPRKG
ncbi:hypothetical protein IOD13_18480 [Brevibacterium casei]|nr:hypothetical protein [Brevibacterium casei]